MTREVVEHEARIFSGNRVTIPKYVREKLGLKPGDSVAFDLRDGKVYISAANRSSTDRLSREQAFILSNES